jgi:hypothetical protein
MLELAVCQQLFAVLKLEPDIHPGVLPPGLSLEVLAGVGLVCRAARNTGAMVPSVP